MKYPEAPLLPPNRLAESVSLGGKLVRLRQARRMRQADAAARAGLSRSTAVLIERGDPGRTLAQILRYLEAIAPATSAARKAEIERQLLAYCHLDTWAMVRLWAAFTGNAVRD